MPEPTVSRETARLEFVDALLDRSGRVGPIRLSFQSGEWVAILGANGAGKSSLLRLAAGAVRPTDGRCRVQGRDPRAWTGLDRARALCHLPQRTPDTGGYTVREQIQASAATPESVPFALEATGLVPLADRSLATLSGGERRRSALAAVLAQESRCLLLDEPFSGLDPNISESIAAALATIARAGALVMVALHDPELALRHATRVVAMRQGIVELDLPTGESTRGALRQALHLDRHLDEGLTLA